MSPAEPSAGPRLGLVLLAAGMSRRMGGANKLLLDLDGMPVVRRAALTLVMTLDRSAPRVVVTGRDPDGVADALAGLGFVPAHNPRYAEGMGTSIAAGVAALPDGLDAILVALGDMPGPRPDTICALATALSADGDPASAIVRPVINGALGHPVLWGAGYRAALMKLEGDQGGRDLIKAHAGRLRQVFVDDAAVTQDIDCPADLDAARGHGSGALRGEA